MPTDHLSSAAPNSIVSTQHHDKQRQCRNSLKWFFSTDDIHRLEHLMRRHLDVILSRLEEAGWSEQVVQMHHIFKVYASDVITMYALAESLNFMDMLDYDKSYFESTDSFFLMTHICFLFPWLMPLVQFSPYWLLLFLYSSMGGLRKRQNWCINQIRTICSWSNPECVKSMIFEGILKKSAT